MKNIILILGLLSCMTTFSQNSQKEDVQNVIVAFFKAFHEADTVALKNTISERLILQTTYQDKEGNDQIKTDDVSSFIEVIGSGRPVSDKWDERISSYKTQIDGNMAHVWTPYEFWLDGKFIHCGVNSFQLFHDNGTWKIVYLIDSRRKSSCISSN